MVEDPERGADEKMLFSVECNAHYAKANILICSLASVTASSLFNFSAAIASWIIIIGSMILLGIFLSWGDVRAKLLSTVVRFF